MRNTKAANIIMGIQAIPIPFSLSTVLGSIMSIINIDVVLELSVSLTVVMIIAMLLAATYTVTFFISLIKTRSDERLSFISFLPAIHFLLALVFFKLWKIMELMYVI